MQRDRGEGEEVPLGTVGRVKDDRKQGVELRLHGDEESGDSDDGPEMECEGESTSFQNFLQQQKRHMTSCAHHVTQSYISHDTILMTSPDHTITKLLFSSGTIILYSELRNFPKTLLPKLQD